MGRRARVERECADDEPDEITGDKNMVQQLNPDRIIQIGNGFWSSKTFLSAVESRGLLGAREGASRRSRLTGSVSGCILDPRADFWMRWWHLALAAFRWTVFQHTEERFVLDRNKPYTLRLLRVAKPSALEVLEPLPEVTEDRRVTKRSQTGREALPAIYADRRGWRQLSGHDRSQ